MNIAEKILQENIPLLYIEEFTPARKITSVSFVRKRLEHPHICKIIEEFIQVKFIIVDVAFGF